MNLAVVAATTGRLLALVALMMLAPLGFALWDGGTRTIAAYATALVTTGVAGFLLGHLGQCADKTLHRKDALGTVALTWLCLGLFGGLPFIIEGSISSPAAALFEAVSGFTTTGATVVSDVDGLSRATNFWRCQMHWIGGMGIVVLFVAVFPTLGVGAKHLFKSEVPGPITEGLRPRIRQTALALWWIYGGLTVLEATLLKLAGMPLFDAVCHAMSTLGTGGFSNRGASVGAYDNALVDWIVAVFMLVAGVNFGLYYGLLRGRWREFLRDYELRFYLIVNAIVIGVISVLILPEHAQGVEGLHSTIRAASFQTLAVTTTTGFMTEDFDRYPDIARYLLFLCMFMGGCAGSTAGGIKASRVFVLLRLAAAEIRTLLRPHDVTTIRLGTSTVSRDVAYAILVFVITYFLIFAVVSTALVVMGLDLITAMSATVACLSSVGPGLAGVGPSQNFMFIPDLGQMMLCFCMIAGRLEIFALLAVFSPECWRR